MPVACRVSQTRKSLETLSWSYLVPNVATCILWNPREQTGQGVLGRVPRLIQTVGLGINAFLSAPPAALRAALQFRLQGWSAPMIWMGPKGTRLRHLFSTFDFVNMKLIWGVSFWRVSFPSFLHNICFFLTIGWGVWFTRSFKMVSRDWTHTIVYETYAYVQASYLIKNHNLTYNAILHCTVSTVLILHNIIKIHPTLFKTLLYHRMLFKILVFVNSQHDKTLTV